VVARYAGRSGDGFICTSGKGPELYRDKLIPAVDEGMAKAGRAGGSIDRMIEIKLSYDRDPRLALENTRFWAPLALTAEEKHSLSDVRQMEAASDALPIETVASRWIVASDPETALAQIKPYVDFGFNHLVIHGPGHDQSRFLTSFSADVMPGLRALMS
jgi:coenzyme F420-dependent glucose-6-phosphate dehydrogenase